MEKTSLNQICNVINGNKSFSIYIHVHTDIDAIGSALALKRALKKLDKVAHVFVDSTFPDNANVFEDINLINNEKQNQYDVCFILDSSGEARLGRLKYKYRKNVKTSVLIDHHLDGEYFAKYNYVDSTVSSTCELVYNLIKCLGVEFDTEMFRLLISGILTDTGGLKFANTKPETLRAVAEMLEKSGFEMDYISMPLFNNLSKESFELRKLAYNRIEFMFDDTVALMIITAKDFKNLNVAFDETKGITDIAMQIGTVKIVALISESDQEEGVYYLSFRTKGDFVAKRIAETFGGGGHLKAAGCKIELPLEQTKQVVIDAIKKEIETKC